MAGDLPASSSLQGRLRQTWQDAEVMPDADVHPFCAASLQEAPSWRRQQGLLCSAHHSEAEQWMQEASKMQQGVVISTA